MKLLIEKSGMFTTVQDLGRRTGPGRDDRFRSAKGRRFTVVLLCVRRH
ncbi:MAG: hypothetical protein LBS00_03700 [Synergistaceae bacterium]|nr:hypothetical protein [Synergistaceae bacterium]